MALRVVLNVTIIAMETPAELTPSNVSGALRVPLTTTAVIRPALPWEALLPISVDTQWTEMTSTAADSPFSAKLLVNTEESKEVLVSTETNQTVGTGGSLQLDSLSRGLVLSSFYWGYMVSQVPGGRLADRFGARRVLAVSLGITSLLALVLPVAAQAGAAGVIAVRLLQGLATGPVLPSLFPLLARWLPADERQTACALITAAQLLAVAAISPAAASLSVALGWQSVFYFTGGIGMLWLLVWWLCMYDSPAEHPAACECELRRIGVSASLPASAAASPPYCAILCSAPVWAIVICEAANMWGQQLLVTLVPLYLKDAVGLDLHTSGVLSGVPHIGRALLGLLLGLNGDLALRRGWLKPLALRRLATVASCGGVSVCLLALPLVAHLPPSVTAALFCLAGLATAFTTVGHPLSTIDVSPTFCGTVFGLANTAGGAASLLSPLAAGAILDGSTGAESLDGWRIVFWLAAAVFILGMVAFLIMASGDRQPWDAEADSSQEKQPIVETATVDGVEKGSQNENNEHR
ncbi:Vesicular glutamate transporter 2 [Amphibalanus amphitrite]|uniref:Vesicular glutamate transporter 2 n=1 Tax=Amphibalanus amphitrite TaxID=1232801 RepID=A0A6A4VPD6_AMPAM|nr:Vesicular glutamate transporter 2 [Amphibalanus amphitrite]